MDDGERRVVLLNETNDFWVNLRHEHISRATWSVKGVQRGQLPLIARARFTSRFCFPLCFSYVTEKLKNLSNATRTLSNVDDYSTVSDFSRAIKKMPQHKRELTKYVSHMSLAENCLRIHSEYLSELCDVEQDLAMGTNPFGCKIKDHMRKVMPKLIDSTVTDVEKMRIVILYILCKNGISEDNFNKLIENAKLSPADKQAIVNLNLLGVNTIAVSSIDNYFVFRRRVPRN